MRLEFSSDRPNSIHGLNGRGKSSVFEAISFALLGKVPRLAGLQVHDGQQGYLNNLFHPSNQGVIDLVLEDSASGDTLEIRVLSDESGGRAVSTSQPGVDASQVIEELAHEFVLLDHLDVQRFVDAGPTDRARELSRLLGLKPYSDTAKRLAAVSNGTAVSSDTDLSAKKTVLKSAQAALSESSSQVIDQLGVIGISSHPSHDDRAALDAWAVARLASHPVIAAQCSGRALSEINFDELAELASGATPSPVSAALVQAQRRKQQILSDQVSLSACTSDAEDLARLSSEAAGALAAVDNPQMKQILVAAEQLHAGGHWDDVQVCPLCESRLESSLHEQVVDQLRLFDDYHAAVATFEASWAKASARTVQFESLDNDQRLKVESARTSVASALSTGVGLEDAVVSLKSLLSELSSGLTSALSAIEQEISIAEQSIPRSDGQLGVEIERFRALRVQMTAAAEAERVKVEAEKEVALIERWKDFIGKASSTWQAAEQVQMQDVLADVDSLSKAYFREIMQAPSVVPVIARNGDKVRLELENFHGRSDVKAKAILSESYRNAYVLSVFLAAAMKSVRGARFVVLDDVTSSFDAGHQVALAELLRTKIQHRSGNGLQVILLSHDALLEKYLQSGQDLGNWRYHKLIGRSTDGVLKSELHGPVVLRGLILQNLEAGDTSSAKSLMRQYLESQLLEVIRKTNIPVPLDLAARDDRKMVGNCLDAIRAHVRLRTDAGSIHMSAEELVALESIHVPAFMANWVTHFETGSSDDIDELMLRSLVRTVDEFVDLFKEPNPDNASERRWRKKV